MGAALLLLLLAAIVLPRAQAQPVDAGATAASATPDARPGRTGPPPGSPTTRPSASPAPSRTATALPGPVVTVLAAGDIATCDGDGDEATAEILDVIEGTVLALGDTAYPHGAPEDYAACYEPSWGRVLDRTRPVPGSHEYDTPGAGGYFGYFGDRAGDPDEGWYSFDLGAWHLVALNSSCTNLVDGCGPGSRQARWLEEDLEAHAGGCILAFSGAPRWSSGHHGHQTRMATLYEILHQHRATVLLSGHDHHYERFEPLDADGYPDARGVRQFVVGTGGRSLRDVRQAVSGSEQVSARAYGVLRLDLSPGGYAWEFLAAPGARFSDAGQGACAAR